MYVVYFFNKIIGVTMKKILPVIIVCSVGLVVCLTLLTLLLIKAIKNRFARPDYEEIELDDDVLTISLSKPKRKKK